MEAAVAYIRVSSQRQVDEGNSLVSQAKQVTLYALEREYELVHIFQEEGESAKTDQRPQLQRLLTFCADPKNRITVVLIPKIDRLARNVYDYTGLKLHLKRLNIRVESLGENIEDTPAGRFTETILASVAQFDNEVRSERSRNGMLEAVAQGRWVWKAPFGFQNTRHDGKGTIEPHPTESKIVSRTFDNVSRHGIEFARRWLKGQGVAMSRSAFYRMVSHKIYVGRIEAFGKEFEASYPAVPLVSEELFARAQVMLRRKVRNPNQRDRDEFALRGSIKCTCGQRLTGYFAKGRSARYAYYRCMSCPGSNLRKENVEALFLRELESLELDPRFQIALENQLRRDWKQALIDRGNSRERILGEIGKVEALRRSLALKNAKGIIPDDLAKEQLAELGAQLTELRNELVDAPSERTVGELIKFGSSFLSQCGDFWEYGTLATKKRLLRFLFPNGVEFEPEKGFRTAEYPLLEQIKQGSHVVMSGLVDPANDGSNQASKGSAPFSAGLILEWLQEAERCEADIKSATGMESKRK